MTDQDPGNRRSPYSGWAVGQKQESALWIRADLSRGSFRPAPPLAVACQISLQRNNVNGPGPTKLHSLDPAITGQIPKISAIQSIPLSGLSDRDKIPNRFLLHHSLQAPQKPRFGTNPPKFPVSIKESQACALLTPAALLPLVCWAYPTSLVTNSEIFQNLFGQTTAYTPFASPTLLGQSQPLPRFFQI